MDIEQLMPHVEALIFASERPITMVEMVEMLSSSFELPIEENRIATCIEAVREKYDAAYYPFQLREAGGGYQFLTKKEYHRTVLQLNGDKHIKKLSAAAMETLAIIAYRQPVTRGDIEEIRGVAVNPNILRQLQEREWIDVVGQRDVPGRPSLFATTKTFLDDLNLRSLAELPPLENFTSAELPLEL